MPKFLQKLVDFFVITIGITRPKPGQEKLAAIFILCLIGLIVIVLVAGTLTVAHVLS